MSTHRRLALLAVLTAALAPGLAGCGSIMMPMSAWMSNEPPPSEITGSIPNKQPVATPQPDADGDVVRAVVAGAPAVTGNGPTWKNDASGNSGTVTRIVASRAVNGAPCRDFETTLTTLDGVRLYRGRTCQGYSGAWDLLRFEPSDVGTPG